MKINSEVSNFIIKNIEEIKEINIRIIHAYHKDNGANIFHIESDSKENVFGLCFKTYPSDDTGVAHILEHTVLCGSKKYPIHDPFFSMLRRSCNTFMNAFTSKLWTGYVASSQIEKDFYNIYEVYLDAVFNPLISKESFMQEGHRLEFSEKEDINSPLTIKGIVFNEMKGVFSSPSSIAWRSIISHLYPQSTYGFDSGGIPKEINKLSHQELIEFHKKYYDKRECYYYFYGDLPLKKHLDFLNEKVFVEKEKKINELPPIKKITRFNSPKIVEEKYQSIDKEKDPTYFSLGYVTCDISNQEETLILMLLDIILMDTDASLLKKEILKSKKCSDVYSLYDSDASEIPYIIYCVGLKGEPSDLEATIINSLNKIVEEGISDKWIEGALHQLEFSKLEISGSYGPYGLELMGRTLTPYLQGANLTDGVKIHSLIKEIRKKLEDRKFLPNFIKRYFVNNHHKVSYTLYPDNHIHQKDKEEEEKELQSISRSMTPEEKENLKKEIKKFDNYQKEIEKEDLSCLPSLKINDIPIDAPYYELSRTMHKNCSIYHHDVFTNDIFYLDLVFDIPQIPENDLQYLRLFSSIIPELGTTSCHWEKNMQRIQQYFGSLYSGLALNVQRENINTCYPTISISSKFLNRNKEQSLKILKDIMLNIDLTDVDRIKDLITQIFSSLESEVNKRALGYALKESAAHISPWTYLSNLWYGLPYYQFIQSIVDNIDDNIPLLIEKFSYFLKNLFHFNNAHIVITSSKDAFDKLKKENFYEFIDISSTTSAFHPWIELPVPTKPTNKGVIISSEIAHNALSIQTLTLTSDLSPALKIATYLLENIYIHKMVREQGGAYGSGVKYNILTGVLNFYSSRDPHVSSTIDAFHKSVYELHKRDISDSELTEAILSYIQDVDCPVPPGCRASVTYFQEKVGLTKEIRQKFRNEILSLKKEDIKKAIEKGILNNLDNLSTHVSYSNEEKLTNANSFLKNKLLIQNV